jgi:hypothetical protein
MIRLVLFPIFLSLLRVVGLIAQETTQSAANSQQNAADGLVRMHEAWGVKASTANASLAIKESTRTGPVIKLRLIAGGVPKDAVYSIVMWPVTQKGPSEVLKGVTLDSSGLAVCAGKPGTCGTTDKPNDPIDLKVQPIPGEPVRLALISADGATKVFAKVVPNPLHGDDRGCGVDAILLTPGAELVLIVGTGFPGDGDVTMDSASEGEHHAGKGKADAEGRYVSAIMPYVQGVAGGVTTVNLKAAKCGPSVKVPWGRRN